MKYRRMLRGLMLLFLLLALFAWWFQEDYVVFMLPPYRVDMSLSVFLLLCLLGAVLLLSVQRLFSVSQSTWPRLLRRWRGGGRPMVDLEPADTGTDPQASCLLWVESLLTAQETTAALALLTQFRRRYGRRLPAVYLELVAYRQLQNDVEIQRREGLLRRHLTPAGLLATPITTTRSAPADPV